MDIKKQNKILIDNLDKCADKRKVCLCRKIKALENGTENGTTGTVGPAGSNGDQGPTGPSEGVSNEFQYGIETFAFGSSTSTITFSPAFSAPPIITTGIEGAGATITSGLSTFIVNPTATDFGIELEAPLATATSLVTIQESTTSTNYTNTDTVMIGNNPSALVATLDAGPLITLAFSRNSLTTGLGSWTVTTVIDSNEARVSSGLNRDTTIIDANGRPGIFYSYNSTIVPGDAVFFLRSDDASGSVWDLNNEVSIDTTTLAIGIDSMLLASGNLATTFYSGASQIYYAYASDNIGSSWTSLNIVAGREPRVALVESNPSVIYDNTGSDTIFFFRSDDAVGSAWTGTPITVASSLSILPNGLGNLEVIDGVPALTYKISGGQYYYVSANDSLGTSWGTPVAIDSESNFRARSHLLNVDETPVIFYALNGSLSLAYLEDGSSKFRNVIIDSSAPISSSFISDISATIIDEDTLGVAYSIATPAPSQTKYAIVDRRTYKVHWIANGTP